MASLPSGAAWPRAPTARSIPPSGSVSIHSASLIRAWHYILLIIHILYLICRRGKPSSMPGFLTDLVNNKVLDCFFGGVMITPPTALYVGLSLTKSYKGGYTSEPT